MKELTDLPAQDLYPIIFRNLSINDLFNCRLVNKQFKYFSDHTDSFYKLVIGHPNFLSDDCYWYHNNKPIEDKEIISLKRFRSIQSLSIFDLDKYLKYLKIYDQEFELEELSNLINLESLEFGYFYNKYFEQIINLKNLKNFASNYYLLTILNTAKLEKIKFYDISKITFDSNPESIKHLITNKYDNRFETFKNLEIIELRHPDDHQSINENLLIIFKNLNQLKIKLRDVELYSGSEIMNSLIKILNDKIKLRKQIDIYLEGVKIENINKLNELRANRNSIWRFRLNNYNLLDSNLSSFDYLRYDQLEECVNNIKNDLPSSYFDKFQNINYVCVDSVNDINGLNWFLNNLKYLITLSINPIVSFGQVFYNDLPDSIKCLIIYSNEDINYDFILRLSKLITFYTLCDEDLFDLLFESFSNLKYLKEFRFYFKRKQILIERKGKDFCINKSIEKLDYNQLVAECNKLRSK